MSRTEHITRLRAAIKRTKQRMDEIAAMVYRNSWCCPGCASPEWRELDKKLERQTSWLKVLESKENQRRRPRQGDE